jgi:hypothetical protein
MCAPRQRFEELPCAGHREWQDQPVRLGEVQRLFGCLLGRVLITQVAAGERVQEVRLEPGEVGKNRDGAVKDAAEFEAGGTSSRSLALKPTDRVVTAAEE